MSTVKVDQARGHELLPDEVAAEIPSLGKTDGDGFRAEVAVKWFCPFGRMTYYVTEFDGEDTVFGYCVSPLGPDCDEWGYASVSELAELTVMGGVPALERDLYLGAGVSVADCLSKGGAS